jgi:hypothetical protein
MVMESYKVKPTDEIHDEQRCFGDENDTLDRELFKS